MFIPDVLRQHVDDTAAIHLLRTRLSAAPNANLHDLEWSDERIAANLDGLAIAGEHAWPLCEMALDPVSAGALFTATVRAMDTTDRGRLDRLYRLFELAEAVPDSRSGLTSALGWLDPPQLEGLVVGMLGARLAFTRMIGVTVCALHRVDPGLVSASRILDDSPMVRGRALRTAGEIGCDEAVPICSAAIRDDDPACAFWAAWSSVLLGNRGIALEVLTDSALNAGLHQPRAFRLALQAMNTSAAHEILRQLAKDPGQLRWLIQGSGIAGDSVYVPWLIKHMSDENTARLAGEAFSLMTGVDLAASKLDNEQPKDFQSGPNDDPADPNVDMDPDEGLPWPDVAKIEAWWGANSSRFQNGARYFMGASVNREHCIDVLKNGYQRQRILAAHYLCLLEPGTPLFNTSAPAWRQQRLLAKMT
jgi:uncharacterized protein (TIGR02270 family)